MSSLRRVNERVKCSSAAEISREGVGQIDGQEQEEEETLETVEGV